MAYNDGILFSPAVASISPFASIRPWKVDIPATSKLLFASILLANVAIPTTFIPSSDILSLSATPVPKLNIFVPAACMVVPVPRLNLLADNLSVSAI